MATGDDQMEEAVQRLLAGQVIAIPTETFYGLAVNPASLEAVDALHRLKGRPGGMGMPLLIDAAVRIEQWADDSSPQAAALRHRLQERFWPGPLTLIVSIAETAPQLAPDVYGPDRTLSFRLSPLSCATALAAAMPHGLITATSANRHGRPPAATAAEARREFPEILVLDAAPCSAAPHSAAAADSILPSTVVDVRQIPPRVVREGAVASHLVL